MPAALPLMFSVAERALMKCQTLFVVFAEAAKKPSDYFTGKLGAVDPAAVESLKNDIPLAKQVLLECAD